MGCLCVKFSLQDESSIIEVSISYNIFSLCVQDNTCLSKMVENTG